MNGQVFVITVTGEMDRQLRDAFDDAEVAVGRGVTRLKVVSPDPSVLHGVIHSLEVLGLELIDLRHGSTAGPGEDPTDGMITRGR